MPEPLSGKEASEEPKLWGSYVPSVFLLALSLQASFLPHSDFSTVCLLANDIVTVNFPLRLCSEMSSFPKQACAAVSRGWPVAPHSRLLQEPCNRTVKLLCDVAKEQFSC